MSDATLIRKGIAKLGSQQTLAEACGVSAQHLKEVRLGRWDMGAFTPCPRTRGQTGLGRYPWAIGRG